MEGGGGRGGGRQQKEAEILKEKGENCIEFIKNILREIQHNMKNDLPGFFKSIFCTKVWGRR